MSYNFVVMQLQLPIFPAQTKLINAIIGFYKKDDFIYYLNNGLPIYCHSLEDRNAYRFILATLVENHLCTSSELSRALAIPARTVQRYAKDLREKGMGYFFNREDNRGQCYKFTEDLQRKAQQLLDQGFSQQSVAKQLLISEGAVRYHMRSGKLKKK